MNNNLTWKEMLESMDDVIDSVENQTNISNIAVDPVSQIAPTENNTIPQSGDDEILAELDRIFTPILVMQGLEGDGSEIKEAFDQASVLTEKNIIKFDDDTRMAQLISTCAILLQRQKNTQKYQMYQKAAVIRNQMKLDMQKEEYNAAKDLAQKYLVKVSTTNNSSAARSAADNLLPSTQH